MHRNNNNNNNNVKYPNNYINSNNNHYQHQQQQQHQQYLAQQYQQCTTFQPIQMQPQYFTHLPPPLPHPSAFPYYQQMPPTIMPSHNSFYKTCVQ